jgi:hypothetical protein
MKIALISRVVLAVATGLMSVSALATESSPPIAETSPAAEAPGEPTPPVQPVPPKGYECHDKALTGSGAGFKDSQEASTEAAIQDWLAQATAIYSDAAWNAAQAANMECVKQGLYSKCFAIGVPCHPKPGEGKASR